MIIINQDACKGCKACEKNCPLDAIRIIDRKVVWKKEQCAECGICVRVCKFNGIIRTQDISDTSVICSSCPVQCRVPEGYTGACKRYTNQGGRLVRNRKLVLKSGVGEYPDYRLNGPVVTGVGAGTNYPCIRPAPHIVAEVRDGVEVVTVVTEAPLSYSGVTVKLDTNTYIGEEGDPVYCEGKQVGMINTEEYGSKMIAIGGANKLTGADGFVVARTIVNLANGEAVELTINRKTKIKVQQGRPPVIDGKEESRMRIGCGSATVGLFAQKMKEAVDEVIVIDHHVVGLFTEHLAGAEVGMEWSGVIPNAAKSSKGRYFGEHGDGIGGTDIQTPRDAIGGIDMSVARVGMQILVINTTGEIRALFEVQAHGEVREISMTKKAMALADEIMNNCEVSQTSVLYVGGTGGSARGGVCTKPLGITRAVHAGKAVVTVGGAPAYVLPGGGINFMVDAGKVVDHGFTWVPTPATVAPIEYTMTREDYEKIGGHMNVIRPAKQLREEVEKEWAGEER
ncbi:NAD-dependent dihydropyrimidine dehydrogenase PreA subunit [Aequitasia blattaphilus]|uniref:4Fe-4S binding protein n=1 Tax=Aequitasia blattaphilus TaxID=2949332 RepID=A0ABT1E7R1_9FIRM|nr:4Fe-4S dicluster domain-containing protein [Aequitasia blattaphilus]MCP1101854.1 4Fe-4S binding protein [Aequitasia blattaphilus]MCR8614494.1 4Fe-4S binding protein [Aequitasia blattaphilus]